MPFCAVSELTTEMRKASSRYGKRVVRNIAQSPNNPALVDLMDTVEG